MPARVLLLALLLAQPAFANDGRNRYESQGLPAELLHWHAPISASQGGYRMLAEDMAGGADGDPAFRWATRPSLALTRLAARRVVELLGPAPLPFPVFDLTSENADTPLKLDADGPHKARGRHPGGSHDGGWNLDLGYYLTSEQGKLETPDYAACTEHHRPATPPASGLVDEHICRGPADRLDTPRQTLFLLELVRQHREAFRGELLEAIGIDAEVRAAVLAQAKAWAGARRFGVSAAMLQEMDRLFASSPYEGWAYSHHHHVHVRLRPLDPSGAQGAALRELTRLDRLLEARLLTAADAAPGGAIAGCALLAELSSRGLARSLELRIESAVTRCALQPSSLRFRIDGGAWQKPRDLLQPLHHVVSVPAAPGFGSLLAEAEFSLADGRRISLKRELALPAQAAWLRVRVEARDFVGQARRDGDALDVSLAFPPAHQVLIDQMALLVRRKGVPELQRLPLQPTQPSLRVPDADGVESIEAEISLSRRIRLRVPVQP